MTKLALVLVAALSVLLPGCDLSTDGGDPGRQGPTNELEQFKEDHPSWELCDVHRNRAGEPGIIEVGGKYFAEDCLI